MKLFEMEGFLRGKCIPRDLKVNETNAEYLVRKFAEADAMCAALAAEKEKFAVECAATKIAIAYLKSGRHDFTLNTPATDAFLAEVRAQGVEEFLRDSQLPYQIATVLADYDSVDDATLQTVIWSGQPPEPDGDVWHLEYVSRGNAIVRAVLKELRKGVQS
ncbi:hypothetical protein [Enterobacter cloacae]|uniref:hypothetical protein n=1 Tax=Enterobacter cloacae TaxID=550 RepID=UPI0020768C03|nr:hypothetical protein [Enterobacter cloacae]MCM7223238.1 hypothetical protein [Enterobacter cloacae]